VAPGLKNVLLQDLTPCALSFAAVTSVLLLLSGGLLFSSKHPIVHATVLGVATGAFVGSLVGISGLIFR
jgi:membrane protein DedA with SNARE-associated domain